MEVATRASLLHHGVNYQSKMFYSTGPQSLYFC